MEGSNEDEGTLTWEDLVFLADWHRAAKYRHIRLLGGEPTLHRHFVDFVLYLRERGLQVTVFTSGIMSPGRLDEARQHLGHLTHKELSFVCNLNEPNGNETEQRRIGAFLEVFGSVTSPGFNLYREDFDISFVFDLVETHQMHRHLRLGLAHPIPGEPNRCIALKNLKQMAKRLASFIPRFDETGMTLSFDCGMPLCIFDDAELGAFLKVHPPSRAPSFRCTPALDIGPDMTIWPCFPLSRYDKRSVFDVDSPRDLKRDYEKAFNEVRAKNGGGLFEECASCQYRERDLCAGGCLAHVIPHDLLANKKVEESQ